MKTNILICCLLFFVMTNTAQNKNNTDHRPMVIKSDAGWNKSDNDNQQVTNTQTLADGIIFSSNQQGIYITLPKSAGNVKLFSLTGEVVWSGNLVQGRFFIPTRPGIYFLKVNNKSYKVVCK
ncbi:MAG: T9SS type A sorting domain-containing protein [Paludibacter sp.]